MGRNQQKIALRQLDIPFFQMTMDVAAIDVNEFVEGVLFFRISKLFGDVQGFDSNQILYDNGFVDLMVKISFHTKFSKCSIAYQRDFCKEFPLIE